METGRTVRTDCTVVESNIHEPQDSELLWDCVRVLTRLVSRARDLLGPIRVAFGNRTRRRLLQANLVGPAGYISMEDGAATGFVQRGVAGSPDRASVIEMGGDTVGSGDSRITETAVRGLWKAWRSYMHV